ncbi:putative pyruvate kinase [Helianthus annuus]|nr:putative pyruvate kinase [Helianthus annuus]
MFEGYTKKKLIVTKNQEIDIWSAGGLDVSLNLGSSSLADGSKWTDWIVAVIINSRKLIPWQCYQHTESKKTMLTSRSGQDIREGLVNFDEILQEADGIILARGNLRIDLPPDKVFLFQKAAVYKCNMAGNLLHGTYMTSNGSSDIFFAVGIIVI